MAEVKGTILTAWMAFLKERYGEQAVSEAIEALDAGDRGRLVVPFLDASWYSMDCFHTMGRLTARLRTGTEKNLAFELGRYTARYIYSGVYKGIFRHLLASDPARQIEKYAWTKELFYRDFREIHEEITGPTSCTMTVRYLGSERPTPGMCSGLTGYWIEMLERAGARSVRAAHTKCMARGADTCEYTFDWDGQE